jgi:hypothetical protein
MGHPISERPMSQSKPSNPAPGAKREDAGPGCARAQAAMRLPMPVPLLLQLYRPLTTLDDVESLAAQLDCARARGCF